MNEASDAGADCVLLDMKFRFEWLKAVFYILDINGILFEGRNPGQEVCEVHAQWVAGKHQLKNSIVLTYY